MGVGKRTVLSVAVIFVAIYLRKYGIPGKRLSPVITTTHGKLQGVFSHSRDGREYFNYLGIPYAKPPIDALRFEPPEVADNWDGVRDATEYGPQCIQYDLMSNLYLGEESCLYLNVHTPKLNTQLDSTALLPVLFFIHGGLFVFGSGDLYRPDYFMDENTVVVTINYRLASFGFLNTGDGVVRGNMGLKDQVLALKFVQQNIRLFGGDPNQVTIFGESAGGASVHYHILSPMSKGLFTKAISQSGLATHPWALTIDPVSQSKKFASRIGCQFENTKEMVSCMKNLTATQVVHGHQVVADPLREQDDVFVPTIELSIPDGKTFLSDHPLNVLKKGVPNKVPLMTGANSEEGLINSAVIARNESLLRYMQAEMEKVLPRLLYLENGMNSTVLNQLREYYYLSDTKAESLEDFKNYTNMFTDRFWLIDLHQAVKYHAQVAPVYLYYYTYSGEFTLTDFVMALKGEHHPILEITGMALQKLVRKHLFRETLPNFGVCHSDELSLQFYMPLLAKISSSHRDYQMSRELVKLWVQFAKEKIDSDGGTELSFLGQSWPPQDPNQPLRYFQLDAKPKLISEPFTERIQFWNSLALAKQT